MPLMTTILQPLPRSIVVDLTRGAGRCLDCGARDSSVCGAILPKHLYRLAAAAVTVSVEAGQLFIQEGDPAEHFFNVTHGTAKLFKLLPDGRRQITGFAGTGHFLGLAVSDNYAFSAEALEPMKVCRFSRTKLRALLNDFPAMEKRLLEVASNELVAAQEQMLLLGRKTARERFASFLITQAQLPSPCLGAPVKWANIITLPMTRSEIADYLGLSMESVSRLFTRFRNDGLIDTPDMRKIVIRDRGALGKASSASD